MKIRQPWLIKAAGFSAAWALRLWLGTLRYRYRPLGPSVDPRRFHRAQVLLDCEFVRVYPDGADRPGVVFPVDDPYSLKMIVDRLPVVG